MKMTEGDFPVTFYDGEREIGLGNVRVKSSLTYKTFQLALSQRIGISPNQITVYLISAGSPATLRRKIPVTNKSDFSLLVRETGGHFLVVLKRTRRNRRPPVPSPAPEPEKERILLRRMSAEAEGMREGIVASARVGGRVFPTIRESMVTCRECDVATRFGSPAAYHHCVRDAVVVGFRSTAGPIAPPRQQRKGL